MFFKEDETTKPTIQSTPIRLWMMLRFSATKAYENHAIVKFLESIGDLATKW